MGWGRNGWGWDLMAGVPGGDIMAGWGIKVRTVL